MYLPPIQPVVLPYRSVYVFTVRLPSLPVYNQIDPCEGWCHAAERQWAIVTLPPSPPVHVRIIIQITKKRDALLPSPP
jgi:hypothetical protein